MDMKYVKIIGIKFDALEGLQVVTDHNRQNFMEAGEVADKESDGDTIFICIPCTYSNYL